MAAKATSLQAAEFHVFRAGGGWGYTIIAYSQEEDRRKSLVSQPDDALTSHSDAWNAAVAHAERLGISID